MEIRKAFLVPNARHSSHVDDLGTITAVEFVMHGGSAQLCYRVKFESGSEHFPITCRHYYGLVMEPQRAESLKLAA